MKFKLSPYVSYRSNEHSPTFQITIEYSSPHEHLEVTTKAFREFEYSDVARLISRYGHEAYSALYNRPYYTEEVLSRWFHNAIVEAINIHGADAIPDAQYTMPVVWDYRYGYNEIILPKGMEIIEPYLHFNYWANVREYGLDNLAWLSEGTHISSARIIDAVFKRYYPDAQISMWSGDEENLKLLNKFFKDGPEPEKYDAIE